MDADTGPFRGSVPEAAIHPRRNPRGVLLLCGGYDSETNKFFIPSLATKLGNALVRVSKLLKAQGFISNNKELAKNTSDFQDVHGEKWNEIISATALRNIWKAK